MTARENDIRIYDEYGKLRRRILPKVVPYNSMFLSSKRCLLFAYSWWSERKTGNPANCGGTLKKRNSKRVQKIKHIKSQNNFNISTNR